MGFGARPPKSTNLNYITQTLPAVISGSTWLNSMTEFNSKKASQWPSRPKA